MRLVRAVFAAPPVVVVLVTAWTLFALNWSCAEVERACWAQKLAKKGWPCKTWEGEISLV